MIDLQQVGDAIAEELDDAVSTPVRYVIAPNPRPELYGVIERPPGSVRDGSLGAPHRDMTYRVRLRAVAAYPDATEAARAAENLLGQMSAALLDRSVLDLAGDGWEVGHRGQIADGGTDIEGTVANATADFDLEVVARPLPPP
jgi:hypothetical protein